MQKVTGNKKKAGRRFTHDMSFIRAVVREYQTSDLSINQLARKYCLGHTQVQKWIQRFSSELSDQIIAVVSPMTPEEQQQLEALKKQNEELLKKLELANLKVTGLEMMIDIAEDELNVDIRKKYGTKQSNE